MKTYDSSDFVMGELVLNSLGQRVVLTMERGSGTVNLNDYKDLKDEPGLKKLIDRNVIWPIVPNFSKSAGKEVIDSASEDLLDMFKKVGKNIEEVLRENVYFPIDQNYVVCTCFIISSYFLDTFTCSPRLILSGSTSSGKTHLQSILRDLCYRGVKIGSTSFAAIFRMANEFSPTLILDEQQDVKGTLKTELNMVFKEGFEPGDGVVKCNPETLVPEFFHVYTPMVVSTKNIDQIPEDVLNRSFVIKMLEAPKTCKIRKSVNRKKLDEIRYDLYRLMFVVQYQRIYHNAPTTNKDAIKFDFDQFVDECHEFLEGNSYEKYGSLIEQPYHDLYPDFSNRTLDMAKTMFPIACLTDNLKGLCISLADVDYRCNNYLKQSGYSVVLDSWVDLIREKNPMTREDFRRISHKISTRYICNRCNEYGSEVGDLIIDHEPLETRAIGKALRGMGFELAKTGGSNMSFVVNDPTYKTFLETNLKKFASVESNEYYFGLPVESNTNKKPKPASKKTNKKVTLLPEVEP